MDNSSRLSFYKRHRNGIALACLLTFIFAIGILTIPAIMYRGDPFTWREEARSLVLHGSLSIRPEVARSFGEMGHFFVYNPSDGKWYSRYGIFNGILNAIPLAAEKIITGHAPPYNSPYRIVFLGVFFVIQSVLIAYILFSITGYYTENLAARIVYILLAFYTTYLWNYLRSPTSECTQLLLFLLCYLCYLRFRTQKGPIGERSWKYVYLGWLSILALCQTKVSYILFIPLFGMVLAGVAVQQKMPRAIWPAFIMNAMIVPTVVIAGMQAMVLNYKFGSPFFSGYHQFNDPTIPHTFLSATADFIWGWQGSVFIHFPLLFLALAGLKPGISRYRLDGLFVLGATLITYLLLAPANGPWRGEWAYGPRYFIFILPLLALPALFPLQWLFSYPTTPQKSAVYVAGLIASVFLVAVQMEINRLDFFFRYIIQIQARNKPTVETPLLHYFNHTNFAKINWDHLRYQNDLSKLSYYAELKEKLTPQELQEWKQFMLYQLSQSNLYWFANNSEPGAADP